MKRTAGTLYVVATPIGNLEDASRRMLRILAEVHLIAAEDTRRARKLLSRYRISTPAVSYYDAIESRATPALVDRLLAGESVALISEAGTPAVSDPGYRLVTAAVEHGIEVVPVPGPSAVMVLLSCCGLPCERFVFEGFLPARKGQRRRRLEELAGEKRAIVFFEPMRRMRATLSELQSVLGDRRAALGRELTKLHEEIVRGRLSEIAVAVADRAPKGEATLVVEGGPGKGRSERPGPVASDDFEASARALAAQGLPPKEMARSLACRFQMGRREAYSRLVAIKRSRSPRPA